MSETESLSESLASITDDILNEEDAYITEQNNNIKEDKYGDDKTFESWGDNNIFFPIASKLVVPLRNLNLTPNHITYLSTIFTFLTIYFLEQNKSLDATISYASGYILDCIDGKMARKYNMATKYGMALDLVSDNISNGTLIGYLINKYGIYNYNIIIILFMSFMISVSYGLNEAILCYKETNDDNFYSKRVKELKGETDIIFTLFLTITNMSYTSYKLFFPTYNEEKIYSWLKILKNFGPGNYCLVMCFVLLNL